MESKGATYTQQLGMLRALTSDLCVLHQAQLDQLKYWGAIAFQYVGNGNWEAQVDVDNKTVSYHLTTKKKDPRNLPQLVAMLTLSIKDLLGPDWTIRILANNKVIYNSSIAVSLTKKKKKKNVGKKKRVKG